MTEYQIGSQSEVPVVVLSEDSDDAVVLKALEEGAQDYLVKGTFLGELLVRVLRYSITRHRLMSELQGSEHRLRKLFEQPEPDQ